MVPRVIKLEKFQALLEQIRTNCTETRPANRFESFYTIKDVNDPHISDKSKEEYKKKYPICEQFPIAVCEPAISVQELKTLEGWLKMYTDYSLEQLQIDHDEVEYVNKDAAPAQFKLALEYKLDADGLSIRCNMGNVRFDSSVYSLKNISILPYAGTGNVVSNEGYVFSADGSGTIINFADIMGSQFKNTSKIYGQDYAYSEISGSNKQAVRLPVFGIIETKNNSYTEKIARALDVKGLMNMQYAIADDTVYVLEANPRASRTVPLVSKVCNIQMVKVATRIIASRFSPVFSSALQRSLGIIWSAISLNAQVGPCQSSRENTFPSMLLSGAAPPINFVSLYAASQSARSSSSV